jgi:hypothetical protein
MPEYGNTGTHTVSDSFLRGGAGVCKADQAGVPGKIPYVPDLCVQRDVLADAHSVPLRDR